jgi:hypothetical protein
MNTQIKCRIYIYTVTAVQGTAHKFMDYVRLGGQCHAPVESGGFGWMSC